MKKRRFNPAFESFEDRLALSTLTIVNDSTKSVYLQLVRHIPATSGQLNDGTSFEAPTPAYTEWTGSYRIAPGSVQNFGPGDSTPYVRLSKGGSSYFKLNGSGIHYYGARYATLATGYDLRETDGSATLGVTLGKKYYGSYSASSLHYVGVSTFTGFYSVPNDETITIQGPNKISGSESFSFADYCGNTDTQSVDHTFAAPHGATVTSFTTNITSSRGNAVYFYKNGNSLVENGFISGGGLFSYGGSYVGTVQVNYSYP